MTPALPLPPDLCTPSGGVGNDALPTGLSCAECGYDLRGQSRAGNCPECGRAVSESIAAWQASRQRPRLVDAPSGRVLVVAMGVWLLVGGALFELAWRYRLIRGGSELFNDVLWLGVLALMHVGGGLLFLPLAEPAARGAAAWRRGLALIYLVGTLTIWVSALYFLALPLQSNSSEIMLMFVAAPSMCVSAAGWLRVATLAGRVPSSLLTWAARLLAAGAVLASTEIFFHHLRNWDRYGGGASRPFLLDMFAIYATEYNVRNNLWRDNADLLPSVRDALGVAAEYGWASTVVLAPLALGTVSVFALRLTRAWRMARRRHNSP